MNCFVAGGSGFIGGALITELVVQGYEVMAMARLAESAHKIKNLGAAPISADMRKADRLGKYFEGCTAVFQLATASGIVLGD